MGLYQHERQDITLLFKDWGYDFLKAGWCGGQTLGLDEGQRYTHIGHLIRFLISKLAEFSVPFHNEFILPFSFY